MDLVQTLPNSKVTTGSVSVMGCSFVNRRVKCAALVIGLLCLPSSLEQVQTDFEVVSDENHAILVDAGSSGSRVHIFSLVWSPGHALPEVRLPPKKFKVRILIEIQIPGIFSAHAAAKRRFTAISLSL